MSIELLIYMIIAAVMVFWLRNTLGTRNGGERDRSEIIDQLRDRQRQQSENSARGARRLDLPEASDLSSADTAPNKMSLGELKLEGGADTAQEIIALTRIMPTFDPVVFVASAKDAFPMIVEAFARGDLETLKMLLSDGVYVAFEREIEDRKTRGETLATDVLAVRDCIVLGVKQIEQMAFVKVRFLAEETVCTRDRDGHILSGNPDKVVRMNDVWTFGKSIKSKDPVWYLYETSDDVVESVPNPMPDVKHE